MHCVHKLAARLVPSVALDQQINWRGKREKKRDGKEKESKTYNLCVPKRRLYCRIFALVKVFTGSFLSWGER